MLFTHAVYHYGTTGIAMGLDAVGGTPEQRHASGMYEAIDKGYQKLGMKFIAAASSATHRLPHRAARAGEPGRRPGGAQDSRHAVVHQRRQHARRLVGGDAAGRGLCRAREGRGGRRGLAGRRRSRHALVRGRQVHAAAGLRLQHLSVPDESQRLEQAVRGRARRRSRRKPARPSRSGMANTTGWSRRKRPS